VHVQPRSARPSVGGLHGDALRVRVAEPPSDGRANQAVSRALAEALDVPARCVELASGARGRRKWLRIQGDPAALEQRLLGLALARA